MEGGDDQGEDLYDRNEKGHISGVDGEEEGRYKHMDMRLPDGTKTGLLYQSALLPA